MSNLSIIVILSIIAIFVVLWLASIIGAIEGKAKVNWFALVVALCVFLSYMAGMSNVIQSAELVEVHDDYYIISYNGSDHYYTCDTEK